MVWGATVRERLLTQHFLQRFLENDLLSPDADHHDAQWTQYSLVLWIRCAKLGLWLGKLRIALRNRRT